MINWAHLVPLLFQIVSARTTPPLEARNEVVPTAGRILPRQASTTQTISPDVTASHHVSDEGISNTGPTRTVPVLHTAKTPIPLAATMGLVMPNPWSKLYAGVTYEFGFVDAVEKPAPTIGGWLRLVQPLLVFPNYTVDVLPASGANSPEDPGAIPEGIGSLCGATAENWVLSYPFVFNEPGWFMFVVNQTWLQPTVDGNNTCRLPLVAQKSFFSWQTFSIRPAPEQTPGPVAPSSLYTVFAEVTTETPTSLPFEKHTPSPGEKLAIGLGATAAIAGLTAIAAIVWWVHKKHSMERERLAFSRLSEADKVAFLAENPDHFLNPNRPRARRREAQGPPAPPGTLAYAQWYWEHMRQPNYHSWRWGRGPFVQQEGYGLGGSRGNMWDRVQGVYPDQPGAPYSGQYPGPVEGYGYEGKRDVPVLVYNT